MEPDISTSPLLPHLEQFGWIYAGVAVVLFLLFLCRIMMLQQTQLKLLETLTREIVAARNPDPQSQQDPTTQNAVLTTPDTADSITSGTGAVGMGKEGSGLVSVSASSGETLLPSAGGTSIPAAAGVAGTDQPGIVGGNSTTFGVPTISEAAKPAVPGESKLAAKSVADPKLKSPLVSPKPSPEIIRKRLGSAEAMLDGLSDEESALELNRKLAYLQAEVEALRGDDALDLPADDLRSQMQMATRLKKFIQQKFDEGMSAEDPSEFALDEINRLERVVDDIADCVDEQLGIGGELPRKTPSDDTAASTDSGEKPKMEFGGSQLAPTASGKFEIGFGGDINRVEKTLGDINEYVEQQLAIGTEVTGLDQMPLTADLLGEVSARAQQAAQNLLERQHQLAAGFLNRDLAFVDGHVDVSSDLIGFCKHRKPDSTLMRPERPALCQFANGEGPLHSNVVEHLDAVRHNCETLQAQHTEQKELVARAQELMHQGNAGEAEKLLDQINPAFTDLGAEELRDEIGSWQKKIKIVDSHLENLKARVNAPWPAPFAKPWIVAERENAFFDEAEAIGRTLYSFQQELITADSSYTEEGLKLCRRLDTRLHTLGDVIRSTAVETRDKSMLGLLLLLLVVFGFVSRFIGTEEDPTPFWVTGIAFTIPLLFLAHQQLLKRTSIIFDLEANGRAVEDNDIAFIKLAGKRFVSGSHIAPGTYQLTLDKSIYEPIAQKVRIRYGRRNNLGAIPVRLARDTYVNFLEMKFVPVPGTTVMFSVWQTRVKDFQAYVREQKLKWAKPRFKQDEFHAAVNVSYEDARGFCRWMTERERKAGRIGHRDSYRLPSDIEWSAAVELGHEIGESPHERSGRIKDVFPWGSGKWPPPADFANLDPNLEIDPFDNTCKVASFAPNKHGLYDLCGNVWEWCDDLFEPGMKSRVLRGGSWHTAKQEMLISSFRLADSPGHRVDIIGFRCVLEIRKPSPLFRHSNQPAETTDAKG
ncbi:MAG: hypothetical protein ACI9OD_004555 [Limisphaerales bacterium]